MMTTPGGCPGCAAPVSDTDLACRSCGASFVGDPNALRRELFANPPPPPPAYALRPAPPAFVDAPVPTAIRLPNPYARPEILPGLPGGPQPALEAQKALVFAAVGLFCFGFALGWRAIFLARRALCGLPPGAAGRSTAQMAYWIGWLDIVGWVFAFIRFCSRFH